MILKGLQKKSKKISTHLLTVLIMYVILHLEQRKGNKKDTKYPEFPETSRFRYNNILT